MEMHDPSSTVKIRIHSPYGDDPSVPFPRAVFIHWGAVPPFYYSISDYTRFMYGRYADVRYLAGG